MQMTQQKGVFIFVQTIHHQELTAIIQPEFVNMFVTYQLFTLQITL